jgi:hypothetical protein
LGKATVNLGEKAALLPLFPKPFPKPTGFWEKFYIQYISLGGLSQANPVGCPGLLHLLSEKDSKHIAWVYGGSESPFGSGHLPFLSR